MYLKQNTFKKMKFNNYIFQKWEKNIAVVFAINKNGTDK